MKHFAAPPRFFTHKSAAHFLPKIDDTDNKSKRGRSLLFAGSKSYQGAAVLAAKAALRAGSGYVTVAQFAAPIIALRNPDFIIRDIDDETKFQFDSVLIGPGFGVNEKTAAIIWALKEQGIAKVILDADALTVCAQWKLFPLLPSWIVTPHSGELARCLSVSADEVEQDRVAAVQAGMKICQCTVLLKGHGTLVGRKHSGTEVVSKIYQVATGNCALAKSGTGDVLAGIITAFRAQGLGSASAALLGAYVHGATANLWVAKNRDPLSMTASDVIELLPEVLYRVRTSAKLLPDG
jgi:ADP-dependent NAD(P)H-hydrate dehydratase